MIKQCRRALALCCATLLLWSGMALMTPLMANAAKEQDAFAGTAISWPLGQALPHFGTPADTLDGLNLVGRNFEERLAATCLQGIVNRTQPQLFIQYEGDDPWPGNLELDISMRSDWKEAIADYADALKGFVVYNPAIQETANVATTIAGISDCIAVTPSLLAELQAAPYSLTLPVLKDLRNEAGITDKYSAYRYLYETYWEKCTRRTICGLAPDGHNQLRDFAVAVKAAVVWLNPGVAEDREIMELFFKDSTSIDTYYTGWWPSEGDGIAFASTYGVMTIPSDFYENYTVYSGMSRDLTIPAIPAKPALENDKIYVSLLLSDGDNIQYMQHFFFGNRIWGNEARGRIPIGFTSTPALLDAGPQLLNYYYRTATENDVLICGPSGLGYSTVAHWTDKALAQKYAAITNSYFERSGYNFITLWSTSTSQRANWYAKEFPALLGMTVQFETGPKIRFTKTDVPLVWLGSTVKNSTGAMSYDSGTENMKERLSAAAKAKGRRPEFFIAQASAWKTTVSDLAELADALQEEFPDQFVFVRPDHFMMLMNEAHDRPHWISLQQRASAYSAAEGKEAAKAFDGTISTGWEAAEAGKASLTVDLGKTCVLERYVLKNAETGGEAKSMNTKAWQLQLSDDGVNWKTIDTVAGNSDGIVYRNLKGQCGRFVRLAVEDPGSGGVAKVQDLEIYGTEKYSEHNTYGFFYSIYNSLSGFVFDCIDGIKRLTGTEG